MADNKNISGNFEVTSVSTGQKTKRINEQQKSFGVEAGPSKARPRTRAEAERPRTSRPSNLGVEQARPRTSAEAERPRTSRPSNLGVEQARPRTRAEAERLRPSRPSNLGVEQARPRTSAEAERPRTSRPSNLGVEQARPRTRAEAERPRTSRPSNLGVEQARPRTSAEAERPRTSRPSNLGVEQARTRTRAEAERPRTSRPSNLGVEQARPRTSAEAERPRTSRPNSLGVEQAHPRREDSFGADGRFAERPRRRILDESGNRYSVDERQEEKERLRDEKEREHNRRRKEIEDAMALFTTSDKPRNYFINLLVTTFKMCLVCVLIICISGIGFVLGMSKSYLETVPELDFESVSELDQSSVLLDVNGNSLGNYYSLENREWASLEEMPTDLQNAVIAIEDVRFRRHLGIDFKRIFSVLISNITSDSMQGGSTITQQLVKNTMLSFEQTYKRKIQEASLALELERKYEKDDILEAYLNTIYMGGSCYGMKTAAKDYFGKELNQLTLRECACLAGMIQNPSRYNPRSNYYSRNNPERTNNRTNLVLYEMCENGLITKEQYEFAKADTFTVQENSPYSTKSGMVYFTDYVIDSVVEQFLIDRGLENNSKNRSQVRTEIRTEGYNIYTTMDGEIQRKAEEATYNFKGYPSMQYSSDSYTVAGRNPDGSVIRLVQPQAAVAIVDYRTGYISALVGGRQAPTGSLEFNRAYQSTMPVGSSIKPIAVYGPAIERGAGTGTIYYDYQMRIDGWGSASGYPANNNRTYEGRVTMRRAFTASLNTTAAQALLYDVGIENSYNTLVQLGVDPEHISKTGSGLALGSSGITPLEMAGAFSCIANMGVYIEPIAFTKVVDKNGNVIVDMTSRQEKRRVFSESTAWMVTDLMRSVALGMPSRIKVPGQTVYGKTGTNSEKRGVFFAGFTGYYTGCVWIGSDAYKPLQSDAQGGSFAAPLFSAVMTAIHKGLPDKAANDIAPETIGVTQVTYCSISGKLATSACGKTHTEYGNPANMQMCDIHKEVEICSVSGALATSACPESTRKKQTLVMIPEKGIFNYMYYNQYDRFVSIAGTPVINMSNCKAHTGE